MPGTQHGSVLQWLWVLPVFALALPPIVWVLVVFATGAYAYRLYDAFWLFGALSPVLGLVTLAILATRYSLTGEELPGRMSSRRVAVLAGLAVIAPVWLAAMLFAFLVFIRQVVLRGSAAPGPLPDPVAFQYSARRCCPDLGDRAAVSRQQQTGHLQISSRSPHG